MGCTAFYLYLKPNDADEQESPRGPQRSKADCCFCIRALACRLMVRFKRLPELVYDKTMPALHLRRLRRGFFLPGQ